MGLLDWAGENPGEAVGLASRIGAAWSKDKNATRNVNQAYNTSLADVERTELRGVVRALNKLPGDIFKDPQKMSIALHGIHQEFPKVNPEMFQRVVESWQNTRAAFKNIMQNDQLFTPKLKVAEEGAIQAPIDTAAKIESLGHTKAINPQLEAQAVTQTGLLGTQASVAAGKAPYDVEGARQGVINQRTNREIALAQEGREREKFPTTLEAGREGLINTRTNREIALAEEARKKEQFPITIEGARQGVEINKEKLKDMPVARSKAIVDAAAAMDKMRHDKKMYPLLEAKEPLVQEYLKAQAENLRTPKPSKRDWITLKDGTLTTWPNNQPAPAGSKPYSASGGKTEFDAADKIAKIEEIKLKVKAGKGLDPTGMALLSAINPDAANKMEGGDVSGAIDALDAQKAMYMELLSPKNKARFGDRRPVGGGDTWSGSKPNWEDYDPEAVGVR